jgi:hypothetical protein
MLNKGINFNILYYYILKRIAYITCPFIINILRGKRKGIIR